MVEELSHDGEAKRKLAFATVEMSDVIYKEGTTWSGIHQAELFEISLK